MKKLLLGNAAVARGAYEAGVNVVASYPGTPSTEITGLSAKLACYLILYFEYLPQCTISIISACVSFLSK